MVDDGGDDDVATASFVQHRNLLFTVAYELLGSAVEAEDVVQETWMRWAGVEQAGVRDARAYLIRIATRQALSRQRTLARRRETYVGTWLPEPLRTTADAASDLELAESLTTAMLLLLETLSPTERAVFVLREVFAMPHDEVAAAVDKSPAAVRQIARRARQRVSARRGRSSTSRAEASNALAAFQRALETGDLQGLFDLLSPGVVALSDGGGTKPAVLRPVHGASEVAQLLTAGLAAIAAEATLTRVEVNGSVGLVMRLAGEVDGVITIGVDEGLITGIYYVRNPDKLRWIDRPVDVTR